MHEKCGQTVTKDRSFRAGNDRTASASPIRRKSRGQKQKRRKKHEIVDTGWQNEGVPMECHAVSNVKANVISQVLHRQDPDHTAKTVKIEKGAAKG